MMGYAHLGIGAGVFAAANLAQLPALPGYAWPVGLGATMLGSLLPDLDHPKSLLGRKLWFISIPIADLFGHRGMTHSLIAVTLAWLAIAYCWGWHTWGSLIGYCLALGYISHLVADWFTKPGIPLMWPDKKRHCAPKGFSFVTSQGNVEWVVTVIGFGLTLVDVFRFLPSRL